MLDFVKKRLDSLNNWQWFILIWLAGLGTAYVVIYGIKLIIKAVLQK